MKRILMLMIVAGLLFVSGMGLTQVALAQEPVGESEPASDGMPGYPAPLKPIPHHEPGQPSRAGSYTTHVLQENELGAQEVVEISGVDAMAADGIDPLAGNYTLVDWDKILFSVYRGDVSDFGLQTFNYISPTLDSIPNSEFSVGNFNRNDIAASDLNGDGQAEQIAAWLGTNNHIQMSIGEMPGSIGRTTSAPAAVAHADGSLDLVVRGYDGALWYRSYDGSSWGDWSNGTGFLLSGPAIVSRGNGQSTAYAIGTDNQVYQAYRWNRALAFDGEDDHVLVDYSLNQLPLAVGMWFYMTRDASYASSAEGVFLFSNDEPGQYGFGLGVSRDENRLVVQRHNGWDYTDQVVPLNQWHHVAVVHQADGAYGLFWDGVQVFTGAGSSTPLDGQPYFFIGGNPAGGQRYFSGLIDEAVVFTTALNQAEIATLYNTGWDSMSGKALGLHMDEYPAVHGTVLADASGQGNPGTLNTSDGAINKSASPGWQAVKPTGDWSPMEAWHDPTPELPAPVVVAHGNGLDLFRLGPDNTLRWQHSDDGSSWGDWQSLGGMLASGPGAASWGPDHVQVFARGADEALWHRTYSGSWGPWQRLELDGMDEGVTIASSPTAVSPGAGQIRVYVRGSDNKPYWIDYAGSSWGSWTQGGGQLASGLGAVWQTDHYELFAQKADGSLQQSSDGVNWSDRGGLPPHGPDIDTGLIGDPFPLDGSTWSNYYDFSLDVETGHFSGDGRQQIVLAYNTTNKAALAVGDWTEAGFNRFRVYNFPDWPCTDPNRFIRVTTGNYDGEGPDEIGVVLVCGTDNYQVQIYSVTQENGEHIIGKYSQLSDPQSLPTSVWKIINTVLVKSGDFDGNGVDEIVVGSSWMAEPEDAWAHDQMYQIFNWAGRDNPPNGSTAGKQPFLIHTWTGRDYPYVPAYTQGFDLAVGNVDSDRADEFITLYSGTHGDYYNLAHRALLVYDLEGTNVLSASHWWVNDEQIITDPNGVRPDSFVVENRQAYRDRLVVADLDHDLVDEVGYLFNISSDDPDWGDTFQLNIYELHESLRGDWYDPPVAASLQLIIPNAGYYNPHLAAGDFTGESLRVGPPSYRVQNRVDTLVAHLNMPPKHRDLVKDAAGDYQLIESPEGECSPSPDSPDCTHAKYAALDFSSSEQTITTQHAYEISAGMENEACVGGGLDDIAEVKACVRTSIGYTHGGNFEKSTEEIESIGFRRKVIAANDDKVVYFGTPYGVWEYPVLSGAAGAPSEDVFITVVFPLISITQYPDTSGGYYSGTCDETWYSAGHQPNNVWSYDPIGEVTFEDYDPDYDLTYDAIEGDWAEGEITYEKLQSAFSSVSFAHSVSAGVETEVSGEAKTLLVNVSGRFKAYVKGQYSYTGMETDKLTTSEETTFSYFLAPQPDISKFTTRVLFYRAKDGYQVLNYQAEPGRAASWQLYNKPDPAFIMPWYGFPDPNGPQAPPCGEDKKLFSPNIVINPSHANLSETVTISATIRNFSGELARNVLVRFYQGNPASNTVIGEGTIPFLSRESGPETVSITWAAAGVGRQKIYAVIDPFDTIPEVHDEDDLINNNMAYGLIQLAATNFADMGLVAKQPTYDAIAYALGNPTTVSLYVPRASLDAVARFEVGGTEIGLPVEGRVFEVAAYQGSKYKLWSDPIANFNLKPEANDPPAVISIAYTQADITALAENDLKLYRLEGTNWTEATCPGYQIHRFPAEDLIAVPICQTGIFAFSDKTPPSPVGETGPVYLPLIIKDSE